MPYNTPALVKRHLPVIPASSVRDQPVPPAGLVEVPGEEHEDTVSAPRSEEGEAKSGGQPEKGDFALPKLIDLPDAGLLLEEGTLSFVTAGSMGTEPRHQESEKPDTQSDNADAAGNEEKGGSNASFPGQLQLP